MNIILTSILSCINPHFTADCHSTDNLTFCSTIGKSLFKSDFNLLF